MTTYRKWLGVVLFGLAGLFVTTPSFAEDTLPGEAIDRETLIRQYGEPTGSMVAGDKEILTYPQGKVIIKDGKVVSMAFGRPAPPDPGAAKRTFYQESGVRFRFNYDPTAWLPGSIDKREPHLRRFGHYTSTLLVTFKTEAIDFPKDKLPEVLLKRLQQIDPSIVESKRERRGIKGGNATYFCFVGKREPAMEHHLCIYAGSEGLANVMLSGSRADIAARYKEVQAIMSGLEITDEATAASIPPPPPETTVVLSNLGGSSSKNAPRNPVNTLQCQNGNFIVSYKNNDWDYYSFQTAGSRHIRDKETQKISILLEQLESQVPADRMALYILSRLDRMTEPGGKVVVREVIPMSGTEVVHLKIMGKPSTLTNVYHFYVYTSSKGTDILSISGPEVIYNRKEEELEAIRKAVEIVPDPTKATVQKQVF